MAQYNKRQVFYKKTKKKNIVLAHTSPANESSDCSNLTFSSMFSNFFS